MCNLSEGIADRTREDEKKKTILRLLKEGASLHMLVAATEWPQEKVAEFLHSKNLQPTQ